MKGYDYIWRSEVEICMCSTEYLSCNNRMKENTYVRVLFPKAFHMAFLKRNSTTDISLGIFRLFLEKGLYIV